MNQINFFTNMKYFHLIKLLVYGYFFGNSKKNFLLYKIFLLLFLTATTIFLVHSVSYGVITIIKKNLYEGYGHIYIKCKKKYYYNEFKKTAISKKINAISTIDSFFIYGIIDSVLLINNDTVPIYLLTSHYDNKNIFLKKEKLINKNSIYIGTSLFEKYKNSNEKKKLILFNKHNKKKSTFHYQSMPINKITSYQFSWDEWNEKALLIDITRFENYFELPSLEYIHIYIKNINEKKIILEQLKKELNCYIDYISFADDILPECNKFILLIQSISLFIISIIIVLSSILLSTLIELYLFQNKDDYTYLKLLGISKKIIIKSIHLTIMTLSLVTLSLSIGIAYCITYYLEKYKIIILNKDNNLILHFIISNTFTIYFIGIYIILIISSNYYFTKKYNI